MTSQHVRRQRIQMECQSQEYVKSSSLGAPPALPGIVSRRRKENRRAVRKMEEDPPEPPLQEEASNSRELLQPKAAVVNVHG